MKYTCPCCGYKTLEEEPPGTFEIYSICFWEDDLVQYRDFDYEGGANDISLRKAQQNFMKLGTMDEGSLEFVRRPGKEDVKDSSWKPL